VDIPRELHEAMGAPQAVNMSPVEENTFFFCSADKEWQDPRWLFKRWLRGWWRRPENGIAVAYPRPKGDRVRMRLLDHSSYLRGFPLRGEFRIVNYHPYYYLMPVESGSIPHSHDVFWQKIQNYHEHRDLPDQETQTHQVSRWLAGLIAATGAKTVLELGCGAGRNLHCLAQAIPGVRLWGVEINTHAAAKARTIPGVEQIRVGSLYDRATWQDLHADVILTSGFLMHLPPGVVGDVLRHVHAQSRLAAFHFELHGTPHSFDYHRYPRDYLKLYQELNLGTTLSYELFPTNDYRSAGLGHFNHALLVSRKAVPGAAGPKTAAA
jgi:SAM-dependent methyltransferase